jgi:hypothetical protein
MYDHRCDERLKLKLRDLHASYTLGCGGAGRDEVNSPDFCGSVWFRHDGIFFCCHFFFNWTVGSGGESKEEDEKHAEDKRKKH